MENNNHDISSMINKLNVKYENIKKNKIPISKDISEIFSEMKL